MSTDLGCPVGPTGRRGPIGISRLVAYLCGPIDQISLEESKGWRIKAAKRLRDRGFTIEDPTERMGLDPETTVNGDKLAIQNSGVVLAHAPKGVPFVGTSMEIFYAYEDLKIPVVVWGKGNGSNPSHWIKMHCTYVCETLDEALSAILGE